MSIAQPAIHQGSESGIPEATPSSRRFACVRADLAKPLAGASRWGRQPSLTSSLQTFFRELRMASQLSGEGCAPKPRRDVGGQDEQPRDGCAPKRREERNHPERGDGGPLSQPVQWILVGESLQPDTGNLGVPGVIGVKRIGRPPAISCLCRRRRHLASPCRVRTRHRRSDHSASGRGRHHRRRSEPTR